MLILLIIAVAFSIYVLTLKNDNFAENKSEWQEKDKLNKVDKYSVNDDKGLNFPIEEVEIETKIISREEVKYIEEIKCAKETERVKKRKTNCDGCPRQENCKYGYVVYDEYDRHRIALWEKYLYEGVVNNGMTRTKEHDELLSDFVPSKYYHIEDVVWLEKLLEIKKKEIDDMINFSKCGKAYAKFMNMNGALLNIQYSIQKAKKNNTSV